MALNNNINKRYLYLAAGTTILLFLGLIYAWSIFKKPLTADFPSLSSFELSMTFTVSMIFFCLGGFFSGRLSGVIGYKKRLFLAAIMIFTGFFCLSQIKLLGQEHIAFKLYVLYGFLCGFGVGIGYNTTISAIVPWFPEKTGFASGVMLMGFGFGGLVLGSAVNYTISKIGILGSFLALSIVLPITIVCVTLLLRQPEEKDASALLALQSQTKRSASSAAAKEPSAMLRTSFFWSYMCWNILLTASGLLVVGSAAQIVMLFGAPAVLGLIISVFNGAGRVIIGALFDKAGGPVTSFVNGGCLMIAGCLLYAGSVSSSITLIVAGLIFCGISFGGIPSITSAWIKHSYGARYYPVNFSIANFSLIPSAIIGPLVSSYLYNRSGGSYNSTFIMIIAFAAIAMSLSVILSKLEKRL